MMCALMVLDFYTPALMITGLAVIVFWSIAAVFGIGFLLGEFLTMKFFDWRDSGEKA